MYDSTKLPVEIWHQILSFAFDAPYVLDTVIDPIEDGCYWHSQDFYHDEKVYIASERQRKTLREVCNNWKEFVDNHQYRWIVYNSNADPGSPRQREAVTAIKTALEPTSEGNHKITPRRFHLPTITDDDLQILNNVLSCMSQKMTTLWLECLTNDWRNQVFKALISHRDMLPNLRCLMLTQPSDTSTPLAEISNAFPKLTGLTMSSTEVIPHDTEDSLALPDLQSLYIDVPSIVGLRPDGWKIPQILRLVTPTDDVGNIEDIGINLVKLYGFQLVFLDLIGWSTGKLPVEFWTWCPVLTELEACYSRLDLSGPPPLDHPLKYIIHCPDVAFRQTEAKETSLLWQNIRYFPRRLKSFIVASRGGWSGYVSRLNPLFEKKEIEDYFRSIDVLCTERSIRVEDETKTALGLFLETF